MTYAAATEEVATYPDDIRSGLRAEPLRARQLDLDQLRSQFKFERHRLNRHQYLYHMGQPFHSIFMIHSGSLKTCELAPDGREQISGFLMSGELAGVESLGLAGYVCDVVALESSEIWQLPYRLLLSACLLLPELQIRLTGALAREIRRHRSWILALGTLSAQQRVAAFLLDVAERHSGGGNFILQMTRKDIASYLVLQHETVSRALTYLAEAQFIAIERREVRILDQRALASLAGFGDVLS